MAVFKFRERDSLETTKQDNFLQAIKEMRRESNIS